MSTDAPMAMAGLGPAPAGRRWRVGRKGKTYTIPIRRFRKRKWSRRGGRYRRFGGGRRYSSRQSNIIIGRGGYSWRGALGAGIEGAASGVGTYLGGAPGGTIGSRIAGGVNTILGLGAYNVKMNTILTDSSQVPIMHSANETIRVCHREYIGDITSSATANTFKSQTYELNPGLDTTFPWMAPIANCFQEYSILGFVAEFKSSSTDALNSTNTALGSVLMTATYNASEDPPDNKIDMMNQMWTTSGKPSQNILLPIECDPSQNPFAIQYVRSGPVPTGDNANMYDLCKITIATEGMQGTSVKIGEMWWSYDIELRKPRLHEGGGDMIDTAHFGYSAASVDGSCTWPLYKMAKIYDAIGCNCTTGNIFTFDPGCSGTFILQLNWSAGTAGVYSASTITYSNCTAVNILMGNSTNVIWTTATESVVGCCTLIVHITNPENAATITFGTNGIIAGGEGSYGDLIVTQINSDTI